VHSCLWEKLFVHVIAVDVSRLCIRSPAGSRRSSLTLNDWPADEEFPCLKCMGEIVYVSKAKGRHWEGKARRGEEGVLHDERPVAITYICRNSIVRWLCAGI
jgi:hypothetical protein